MKSFRVFAVSDKYDLCVVTGYAPDYNVFLRDKQGKTFEIGATFYKGREVEELLDSKPTGDVIEHYRELAAKIVAARK